MGYNGKQLMNNLYCDPHNFDAAICHLQSSYDHWKTMTRAEAEDGFVQIIKNYIGDQTKDNIEQKTGDLFQMFRSVHATIHAMPPQTTGDFFPPKTFGYFFVQFYQVCG